MIANAFSNSKHKLEILKESFIPAFYILLFNLLFIYLWGGFLDQFLLMTFVELTIVSLTSSSKGFLEFLI